VQKREGGIMTGRWTFAAAGLLILLSVLGICRAGSAQERYTVKSGDTLYELSRSFGVSVDAVKQANKLGSQSIRKGQILIIPVRKSSLPDETARQSGAEAVRYTVKKGDTLHSVAKKAGVAAEEIKAINQLRSSDLKIGQTLVLRKNEPAEEAEEAGEPVETSPEPVAKKEETIQEAAGPVGKWSGTDERNLLVRVVKNFLGVPYRLGGSTLKGIDCSAFVKKIYEIFNVHLPRTAREQFRFGKKVDKNQLEEGDLVFFKTRRGEYAHVGIYIGNNEFVHASVGSKEVKIDNLDTPYFSQRFNRGVRIKEFEGETQL
jgi:cell wall-associated NlpC family hydrolase